MPRATTGKSRARGDWKLFVIYECIDEKGQVIPNARARFVRVEKDKMGLLDKFGQGTLREKFMVVVVPMGEKDKAGEPVPGEEKAQEAQPSPVRAVA